MDTMENCTGTKRTGGRTGTSEVWKCIACQRGLATYRSLPVENKAALFAVWMERQHEACKEESDVFSQKFAAFRHLLSSGLLSDRKKFLWRSLSSGIRFDRVTAENVEGAPACVSTVTMCASAFASWQCLRWDVFAGMVEKMGEMSVLCNSSTLNEQTAKYVDSLHPKPARIPMRKKPLIDCGSNARVQSLGEKNVCIVSVLHQWFDSVAEFVIQHMPHQDKDRIQNKPISAYFDDVVDYCWGLAQSMCQEARDQIEANPHSWEGIDWTEDGVMLPTVADYLAVICPTENYFAFWWMTNIQNTFQRTNKDAFGRCDICTVCDDTIHQVCCVVWIFCVEKCC